MGNKLFIEKYLISCMGSEFLVIFTHNINDLKNVKINSLRIILPKFDKKIFSL